MDEQDNILYQIAFPLNNLPGTLSISLPQTSPALALDQKYYWYLEILCTQDDFSQPFVSGWLMRVPLTPELLTQLETATPEEKLAIYAKTGLWHDLFATLAQLRQTHPKNIHFATLWEDLLIQEGLEQIASKPLVDCCKFSELEK